MNTIETLVTNGRRVIDETARQIRAQLPGDGRALLRAAFGPKLQEGIEESRQVINDTARQIRVALGGHKWTA